MYFSKCFRHKYKILKNLSPDKMAAHRHHSNTSHASGTFRTESYISTRFNKFFEELRLVNFICFKSTEASVTTLKNVKTNTIDQRMQVLGSIAAKNRYRIKLSFLYGVEDTGINSLSGINVLFCSRKSCNNYLVDSNNKKKKFPPRFPKALFTYKTKELYIPERGISHTWSYQYFR